MTAPVSDLLEIYTETTEKMQHGVMWINEEGHIIHVNTRLIRELGYERQDFATKTIFQISPYINFITWRNHWNKLNSEGKITLETQHLAADNTIRPMKMHCVMIEVQAQKVCMGIVESELVLTPYIDLLQMLSEMLNAGGWQWTIVDNNYFFTREMYRLLELPENLEITNENVKTLLKQWLPERDYNLVKEKWTHALATGEPFELEVAINLPVSQVTRQFWLKGIPYFREEKATKIYGTLQDISAIAHRTEDMYLMQYATDNAQEIIYWIKPDGTIRYVNDAMCQLLGYTREALLQLKFMDLWAELNDEPWEDRWQELQKNGVLHMEVLLKSKKGADIPVSVSIKHQNFLGIELGCAFARDLRSKKRRDQFIRMASHTVSKAKEMIYWLDGAGNFVYVNAAFYNKLGCKQDEIIGKNIAKVYPNYAADESWKRLKLGQSNEIETIIIDKNNARIPVEISETLIVHEGNEYCCGIVRDVTERKKKEAELQRAFEEIKRLKEQLELDNRALQDEIAVDSDFNNIISASPAYKKVLKQIEQVADTEATVLILGETGTGKELLARALHQLSRRSDRPMIKINCGALPENLIESELFGHEKGAFTGAYQQKKGRFELADKGTIFLDEIGELPLDLQAKLLRVLQEGEFERVGGTQTLKVNVRVIAATNRNLEQLVQTGKFRQDLFYRLNVFPIYNIPLRERREDIPLLIDHFVRKFSQKTDKRITEISQNALDRLLQYEFPGNVRELENIIERAVILSTGRTLKIDTSFIEAENAKNFANTVFKTLEEMQRDYILEALRRTNGQVSGSTGAAKLLGVNDKTLHSKMKKLQIDRRDSLN
ncbi:MAG: sigma 54-interacting transcriptional regulator [Saprospiraceae bacterium]